MICCIIWHNHFNILVLETKLDVALTSIICHYNAIAFRIKFLVHGYPINIDKINRTLISLCNPPLRKHEIQKGSNYVFLGYSSIDVKVFLHFQMETKIVNLITSTDKPGITM